MVTPKIRNFSGLLALLCASTFSASALAQTSGDNGSHDPSRMIESNARVYIYSTGGGAKSSADGLVWRNEASPPWNKNLLPNNQGIWAPDGIYLNGQYYLYGSMWTADKSSALVLLTSPTLDPSAANYKWTDQGVAVAGPVGVTHSVIDPAPILDADGNLWVSWGGGYPFSETVDSIFVTRMDNQTGLPVTSDPGYKPPDSPGYAIAQGHKEGSYLYYHGGNYFLWYQTGSCCSGTASTYTMHVARASAITGPYSGDRTFYAGSTSLDIHGPGHIGIYDCGGVERFTYHYYPNNGSVIGENTLTWGSDGWPVAGVQVTTGLKLPCADMTPPAGGAGGTSGTGSAGASALGGAGGTDNTATGGGAVSSDAGPGGGTDTNGGAFGTGGNSAAGGPASTSTGGEPIANAGSSTEVGGASATPSASNAEAGCGCEMAGNRGTNRHAALLLFAAITVLAARRRRS